MSIVSFINKRSASQPSQESKRIKIEKEEVKTETRQDRILKLKELLNDDIIMELASKSIVKMKELVNSKAHQFEYAPELIIKITNWVDAVTEEKKTEDSVPDIKDLFQVLIDYLKGVLEKYNENCQELEEEYAADCDDEDEEAFFGLDDFLEEHRILGREQVCFIVSAIEFLNSFQLDLPDFEGKQ